MLLTHRAKYEGALVPRFYGLAYREPSLAAEVYYLIPFNLFVRWWMGVWCWLVWGRGNKWDRALSNAEFAGFRRGRELGYNHGQQDAEARITAEASCWRQLKKDVGL